MVFPMNWWSVRTAISPEFIIGWGIRISLSARFAAILCRSDECWM